MSAWVRASERKLDVRVKEQYSEQEEIPTFSPTFISNPELRLQAKASGYGSVVPPPPPRFDPEYAIKNSESYSFSPKTDIAPSVVELRQAAKSSAYGSVTVKLPPKKEVEIPTFTPELIRSKKGTTLAENAVSNYYGSVVPAPPPKKEAPVPTFTPALSEFNESVAKARAIARSSSYGTVIPTRPVSAPAAPSPRLETMHTLLADRTSIDDSERPPSPKLNMETVKFHPLLSPFQAKPLPPAPAPTTTDIKSSGYGKVIPLVKKEQVKTTLELLQAPVRDFDKGKKWTTTNGKVDDFEPIPVPDTHSQTTVGTSSGYGTQSPVKGEKREIASEPAWTKISKKSSLVDHPGDIPVVQNSLTSQVESSMYGKVPPVPSPRPIKTPEACWKPNTLYSTDLIPQVPDSPRSVLYDHVQSHYGRSYSLSASLRMNNSNQSDN